MSPSTSKSALEAEYKAALTNLQKSPIIPPPRPLEPLELGNPADHEEPRYQEDPYDDNWKLVRLGKGRGLHMVPKLHVPPPTKDLTLPGLMESYQEASKHWKASRTRKQIFEKARPGNFDVAICVDWGKSFSRGSSLKEEKAIRSNAMRLFAAFMDLATHKSEGKVKVFLQQPDYVFTELDKQFLGKFEVTVREISKCPAVNAKLPDMPEGKRTLVYGAFPSKILTVEKEKRPEMMVLPYYLDGDFVRVRKEFAEARKNESDAAKAVWEASKFAERLVVRAKPLLVETYDSMMVNYVGKGGKTDEERWFSVLWKREAKSEKEDKKPEK